MTIVAALIAASLMACAGSARRQARTRVVLEVTLETSAQDYWDGLRWGQIDQVGVHALDKAVWMEVATRLLDAQGTWQITDWALVSADVELGEDDAPAEGHILVRYDLVTLPTNLVEHRTAAQRWIRVDGQWRLEVDGSEADLFLPTR